MFGSRLADFLRCFIMLVTQTLCTMLATVLSQNQKQKFDQFAGGNDGKVISTACKR